MKKLFTLILSIFVLTGCSCTAMITKDTPTKKVEAFLNNYQTLNEDVLTQLKNMVERELTFTEEQKDTYHEFMKKHYQDLTYEIKDEIIDGDNATVTVEIEVRDYSKVMSDADTYLAEHPEDFRDSMGAYDVVKFNEYRLGKLKESKEKVKYTLNLTLTKVDDEWRLDDLSEVDESKIQGTYKH